MSRNGRRDIEIFLTLADELHFGRTAERLHVSQARVSQTITRLERRLGVALFERTSRRVGLTPVGRRLLADLQPAHQQIEEGIARAIAAGRDVDGVLPVGFEAPAVADLVVDVIELFRRRHPGSEVQIREAEFTDPLRPLRAGEVDILVTNAPIDEPDITAGPVVTEPVVLAVSARHPFARRDSVTLDDLARDTVLRAGRRAEPYWNDPPAPWTTPNGAPVHRGPDAATLQELLALIAAGAGVCPLAAHATRYFARPTLTFVPFAAAPPVEWVLAWRTAGATSRIRAFARAARDAAGRS